MNSLDGTSRLSCWEQAEAGGVYPWNERGWLELTGRDRAAFLHSFCTQEIKKLVPGDVRETFFCQGNGKIVGHGFVVVEPDRLLIATPREHLAALERHLDRFIIREDVRLADRSDAAAAALFCGAAATGLRRAVFGTAEEAVLGSAQGPAALSQALSERLSAAIVVYANPWDPQDRTLWVEYPIEANAQSGAPTAAVDAGLSSGSRQWLDRLRAVARDGLHTSDDSLAIWDKTTFDAWRIALRAPLYGREITAEQLPQEVGRDARAISFNKGCYLGQEPVAGSDALGHVNWELVAFQIAATPTVREAADSHGQTNQQMEMQTNQQTSQPMNQWTEHQAQQRTEPSMAAGPAVLSPGATVSVDGKPVLRIATILPMSSSGWTHAGLGYVRREARRTARSSVDPADPVAEGVLATSAGMVRIEPRLFLS
ncbi:MAG: YgfZ/GcvT domain-containing protein [Planctomycetota bacterium]